MTEPCSSRTTTTTGTPLYYSDPGSKYEYSILLPVIVDPHLLKYTVLTSIINAILMHLCCVVRMVLVPNLPVLFNLVDIIASMSKYLPKHLPSQTVTIPIGTGAGGRGGHTFFYRFHYV